MENMNMLLVAIICFFIVCIALGLARGLVKNLAVLASTILTMVLLMSALTPAVNFVAEHTDIEQSIADRTEEKMMSLLPAELSAALEYQQRVADGLEEVSEESGQEMTEDSILGSYELTVNEEAQIIENSGFPQFLKDKITENNNDAVYAELGVNNFIDYFCHYIARLFVRMGVFVVLFILITLFLRVIILSMEKITTEIPLLRGINAIAGGFMGIGVALTLIWVFFVVITLFCTSGWAQNCFDCIEDSSFLTMLYEKNVLISSLTRLG